MPKKKEQDDDDVSSVDVDEEVNEVEDDEAANDLANADVVTKYQTAGKIANECLAKVIAACVPGTKAVTLCLVGDEVRARASRDARCAPPAAARLTLRATAPRRPSRRPPARSTTARARMARRSTKAAAPRQSAPPPPPCSGRPRRLRHLGARLAALAWPTLPGGEGRRATAPGARASSL